METGVQNVRRRCPWVPRGRRPRGGGGQGCGTDYRVRDARRRPLRHSANGQTDPGGRDGDLADQTRANRRALARDRPVGADAATRRDSATGRSCVAPLLTRWGEQETSTLRATRSPNTTPWGCDPGSPNNPTNDHELAFQFTGELSDDARSAGCHRPCFHFIICSPGYLDNPNAEVRGVLDRLVRV